MSIIAKYPGICKICNKPINAGDQINWEKGAGAAHAGCGIVHSPGRRGCGSSEGCLPYHNGDQNCCIGCPDVGLSYNELHGMNDMEDD